MAELIQDQQIPKTSTPSKFNLKKVLITAVAILVVAGLIAAGVYWYVSKMGTDSLIPYKTNKQATNSASKSSSVSNTLPKKDETADWKTFNGPLGNTQGLEFPKHSFKYPSGLKIAIQPGLFIKGVTTDTEAVKVNGIATGEIQFAGLWEKDGYFQAIFLGASTYKNIEVGTQGWKFVSKTDATLGGKTATRAVFTHESILNSKQIEYYSEFTSGKFKSAAFVCHFITTSKEDLEKMCDLMASTFKFL